MTTVHHIPAHFRSNVAESLFIQFNNASAAFDKKPSRKTAARLAEVRTTINECRKSDLLNADGLADFKQTMQSLVVDLNNVAADLK